MVGSPPPPATTDNIFMSGVDPVAASLYWTESGDFCFDSYTLQIAYTSSNGPWSTLATVTSQSSTTAVVEALTPSTTEWFQIIDTSGCFGGTATSNQLQVTQPPMAALSVFTDDGHDRATEVEQSRKLRWFAGLWIV